MIDPDRWNATEGGSGDSPPPTTKGAATSTTPDRVPPVRKYRKYTSFEEYMAEHPFVEGDTIEPDRWNATDEGGRVPDDLPWFGLPLELPALSSLVEPGVDERPPAVDTGGPGWPTSPPGALLLIDEPRRDAPPPNDPMAPDTSTVVGVRF
jgi:hypothetical protein